MSTFKVAAVSLNQTPLDWAGNQQRIIAAIGRARAENVRIACFQELCVTAYGCEDVFLGKELFAQALRSIQEVLPYTEDIAVVLGCPILYKNKRYNAAVLIDKKKIVGIYPKHVLANIGVYYEPRWFSPWGFGEKAEFDFFGEKVPLGGYLYEIDGRKIAFEICEDAWAERRPIAKAAFQQAEVVFNLSASHFAFAKFERRQEIVCDSSEAFDTTYVYVNAIGNESGRLIFDGGSMIAQKGRLVAGGLRFSFNEIEMVTLDIDAGSDEIPFKTLSKYEEFSSSIALGLFDYLRKSKSRGFVVSLSGGADSSSTAILCAEMIHRAVKELGIEAFKSIFSGINLSECHNASSIVSRLLTCIYQSTENSSSETLDASKSLATELRASFIESDVQPIVDAYSGLAEKGLSIDLSWDEHDISMQNIQARVRGPLAWFVANLEGKLLLATSNRSEAAVGYTTMDGDTCGGFSPIGGIDKAFLLSWLKHLENEPLRGLGQLRSVSKVNSLEPTAELRPVEKMQTDEKDLMPYAILDEIETLAIGDKMFESGVVSEMLKRHPETERAQMVTWVAKFFAMWTRNQWKRERYAPSFHLDDKNLDPKTWCRYPILSGG